MKLSRKKIISASLLGLFLPAFVFAQSVLDQISGNLHWTASVYNQPDLNGQPTKLWLITRVGAVMQIFLSLLGLVMIILIIYGGYLWMTARGNDKQVEEAQHTIRSAIIGALVIIAAGAITGFVLGQIGGQIVKR